MALLLLNEVVYYAAMNKRYSSTELTLTVNVVQQVHHLIAGLDDITMNPPPSKRHNC